MANRRRYTDEFRASAVLMLEAAGYPDTKGALATTSKHLKVNHTTLRNWYHAKHNPPPSEVRLYKKSEIVDMLRAEIGYALQDMPNARPDASWRDLTIGTGVLVDKLQILTDQPTERTDSRIKIVTDANDYDTFAPAAPGTNGRSNEPQPIQLPVNGTALGKNGTGPKADD